MAGGLFKIAICFSLLAHAMGFAAAAYFFRPGMRATGTALDQATQLVIAGVEETPPSITALPSPDPPASPPELLTASMTERPREETKFPIEPVMEPKAERPTVAIPVAAASAAATALAEPQPAVAAAVTPPVEPAATGLAGVSGSGKHAVVLAQPDYRKNSERVYPADAMRRHEQGLVLVMAVIDSRGHAKEVGLKQTSGFRTLDDAALKAVRSWEFEPARVDGRPVESQVEVPVNYKLAE